MFARRFHALVGVAACSWGIAHELWVVAHRHGIKPYTTIGWLREQVILGLAFSALGCGLVATRRPRLGMLLLAAAALLGFSRYFTLALGGLAIAALLGGLGLALSSKKWLSALGFGVPLALATIFVAGSVRTAELMLADPDWRDRGALRALPLDDQFVATSLVYNSGILFSRERVGQIVALSTRDYLVSIDEANRGKRPPLPIGPFVDGEPLPEQRTSWSAVYHVLQRYGAWVALRRFN